MQSCTIVLAQDFQKMKRSILYIALLALVSSCAVFKPSFMLRSGSKYPYAEIPEVTQLEYRIANNDVIEFRMFSNNGFKLIDLTNFNKSSGGVGRVNLAYLIEHDGMVKLPIVGRIKLAGYTIREAEIMLEEIYSKHYNKPFVMMSVTNQRVIIFPGGGGSARVINLENNNTTLLEALALAGGISGKAHKIKLIRGSFNNPQVYLLDLSTLEGVKNGDMVIQANDIIYVDPVLKVAKTILGELTPIISLLSSLILIWTIIQPSP